MFGLDALWWAASAKFARRRRLRVIIACFMAAQIAGLLWLVGGRTLNRGADRLMPKPVTTAVFVWHFFGLTLVLLSGVGLLVYKPFRWLRRSAASSVSRPSDGWSRRDFLEFAVAAGPPLLTVSLTGIGLRQLEQFRVRRIELPVHGLPPGLDGLTIAQVSDMHVGRFTTGNVLRRMVTATNDLRADLVLLTGDLINDALADLPAALDYVRAMEGRHGCFIIEGNHDLIEDGREFERQVRASGIPFLLDEVTTLRVRGVPLQLLGLSWTRGHSADRDRRIAAAVRKLADRRDPAAFPIFMAHHPHAFDAAADVGLPLILSGHTHGGQLMLNEQLGFGPAIFRYWSGLYTRGRSRLIVSNGVGNWFPLRVAAPAEIIHLTLRSQARS